MSIFSIFKGNKLKVSWRFEAAGTNSIIWKLLISPSGILVGEERDVETKTAALFAIDVATGKTLWRNVKLDEQWWFNSELATPERIYIHRFGKPDMPEPKGIIVLDIRTGAIVWEQPDVAMLFEVGEKMYVQREGFGRKEFFSVDSKTGEILEAFGSDRTEILQLRELANPNESDSHYSLAITPDDELFGAIGAILKESLDVADLRGSIDYLEFGDIIAFSYHERITGDARAALGGLLRNELRILDRNAGDIIYSDTVAAETPYPVPESFFITSDTLIYVKEKREIIGIRLT